MPRSRKRHHSRSRSKTRSRSPSRDKSHEKSKKPSSNEKDGKRRRLDELVDSPVQKRSLSADDITTSNERIEDVQVKDAIDKGDGDLKTADDSDDVVCLDIDETDKRGVKERSEGILKSQGDGRKKDTTIATSESPDTSIQMEVVYDKADKIITPKKALTPKQVQKALESEKKKRLRQKEREEREKQKLDEKAKLLAEKQKLKEQKEVEKQKLLEEKQRQLELKQKEKEMKEEQRRKEREEKEQKRKEKEEQEAQKRKEKEEERLKKLQEIEEKNKEKQKEEEKKQKTAALFKNFFKKTENEGKEFRNETFNSNFMPFEVKSDMRLPPLRRSPLSEEQSRRLEDFLENQYDKASYLYDLKHGSIIPGKCNKTWPHEDEDADEDVTVIEDDKVLGETICEDKPVVHKMKVKFFLFNENRRPAYRGTWRRKTKCVKPRRPFAKDKDQFNYEEDSDDDWEQEEQGESLEISGDEEEKETENDDEYDIDNDFFVPHGHLSDDEVDDEENARLSPESLKQKLQLLKAEFDEDIKSKTHKLKPRSIGVIWHNETENKIDDAIYKYLQPFAMMFDGEIEIKKRSDIFGSPSDRKRTKASKGMVELPMEHIPRFLKIIHGNANKKKTVIEEFLTFMADNGITIEVSKANLLRFLKSSATYKKCKDNGPMKNKFGWFVNDSVKNKYNVDLELSQV